MVSMCYHNGMSANYPLRELRNKSGKTPAEIVEAGRKIHAGFPPTKQHLFVLESRGTRDFHLINAIAKLYGISPDAAASAATPIPQSSKSVRKSLQSA